jgi:hypothetical protein
LRYSGHQPKGLSDDLVPLLGIGEEIVRVNGLATGCRGAGTAKIVFEIQRAIIVGEFFARIDVAYGQLKVIAGAAARGIT